MNDVPPFREPEAGNENAFEPTNTFPSAWASMVCDAGMAALTVFTALDQAVPVYGSFCTLPLMSRMYNTVLLSAAISWTCFLG
jgi:hypothetical protein